LKNNNKILFVSAAMIFILILLYLVITISYRNRIPDQPDKENITDMLKDQIKSASRKAHFYPSAHNLGILGMIYHSSAYYDKAAECYSLATKKNSSKWIWSYYLGYLNKEMGESEKAIANFSTVVKTNPEAYHAWFYLGEIYQDLRQDDKAEDALNRISSLKENKIPANKIFRIDHFPLGTYASYLHAKLLISTRRNEYAEDTLKEIIKYFPNFGPAYRLLGNIYQTMGDSVKATKYIHQANDNIYSTAPVDTLLDMIALRSRSELFILKQIDEADYFYYYDWALTLADHALNYLPDNKYLLSKTIKLLLKTDSGTTALSFLDRHLESYKDDFAELKQVADMLYEKKFYIQSGTYYSRALELQPENSEIQANLIFGLLNEGKEQQALSLLDRYLNSYGNNPQVVTNAVYIMLFLKKEDKAGYYLEKLRKLSPADTKTFLLSGYVAQQKGDLNKARELFEKSFNNTKKELLAAQSLGDILIRQKKWKKSIDHFKQALEYFPNEPYIIEKLGSLLIMCPDSSLRDYNEGVGYLERLLIHRTCPPETKIFAGRGLTHAYYDLGDKTNAAFYAGFTINLVRNYNIHEEIINELQDLSNQGNLTNKRATF
jgi:tetratricopeptide (TPR) repeat protein